MNIKPINRKGQLGGLSTNIIVLGVAAITLVLFLVILQELRDTDILTKAASASFSNETLTTVTEAGELLVCNTYPASECSVNTVTNATSGTVIPASNFTVNQDTCRVSFAGAVNSSGGIFGGFNNSNWNVTYSCSYGDTAYTSGNKTVVGLGTFGDFWTIIVLAVVAAVVLGIIFALFGGRRQR